MSRPVLALDPGHTRSALVLIENGRPTWFALDSNDVIRDLLMDDSAAGPNFTGHEHLVVEQIESFGMAVGAEVFETVFWAGRFVEAWGGTWSRLTRRAVKLHLCGQSRAKDANVRAALLNHYGPGKEKAVGVKRAPGPLYGIKLDLWAALAVGVTYVETCGKEG